MIAKLLVYSHKHYQVIPFWSCFNDLHENSEPYMKTACFGGVCLQKREYFNSHRFPAMSSWIFITQRYQRRVLSMRTNVVLPVSVPTPEVRPAAGLIALSLLYQMLTSHRSKICAPIIALLYNSRLLLAFVLNEG